MERKEYEKQYRENHKHPCPNCGKIISHHAQFCGSCSKKHAWASGKYHFIPEQGRGVDAPHWKGGRIISDGYIFIRDPNHHRAQKNGYVQEHVMVWEEANNRPLPEGWVIHHLNGIRSDNRPKNLAALPNMKHKLVLDVKAKRIQELEAMLRGQGQLV